MTRNDASPPSEPPTPYRPPPGVARSAAEVLRGRFAKLEGVAKRRKSDQYIAQAKAAFSRGDYRLAAEAYRLASELDPEDRQLALLAEQAAEHAERR